MSRIISLRQGRLYIFVNSSHCIYAHLCVCLFYLFCFALDTFALSLSNSRYVYISFQIQKMLESANETNRLYNPYVPVCLRWHLVFLAICFVELPALVSLQYRVTFIIILFIYGGNGMDQCRCVDSAAVSLIYLHQNKLLLTNNS